MMCAWLDEEEAAKKRAAADFLKPLETVVEVVGRVAGAEKVAKDSAERIVFKQLVPIALKRLELNLRSGFTPEGELVASKVADAAMDLCLKGSGILAEEGRNLRPIIIESLVIATAAQEIVSEDRQIAKAIDVTPAPPAVQATG